MIKDLIEVFFKSRAYQPPPPPSDPWPKPPAVKPPPEPNWDEVDAQKETDKSVKVRTATNYAKPIQLCAFGFPYFPPNF